MAEVGFIGMGNMGYAIMKGALKVFPQESMVFTAKTAATKERVKKEVGVSYFETTVECVNAVKYVILAIKPQYYDEVLKQIRYVLTNEHILISMAPGISIENLKEKLGEDKRIVRVMPNTPALIGEGMTGITYRQEELDELEIEKIKSLFEAVGKCEYVEERLMNAVTCASGSSPAYVYQFIEALADGVVKYGMPREQAYTFVAQAVAGAAKMVLETKEHPGVLKDKVCSPGGTTIAGIAALEEYGMRNAILKACDACYEKGENVIRKPFIH